MIPVKSPIHPDLLDGRTIDFMIDENGRFLAGTGSLWAVRGTDGADYVEMTFETEGRTYKKWLTQDLIDHLKEREHPEVDPSRHSKFLLPYAPSVRIN